MSRRTFVLGWAATMLAASLTFGQRKAPAINAETPHGALMQQIGQENDTAKKAALLEELVAKFGADPKLKNEMLWAYPIKLDLHVKSQEWDKAIDAGTKALVLDDSYVEVAVATLKAAEGKKDYPLVKSWAQKTSAMARKSVATPKLPEEEDEAAKTRIDYARQVAQYADYALFNAALQSGQPAVVIEMAETLKAQNPSSEYWPQLAPQYVFALNSTGQTAKAVSEAEEVLLKDSNNTDLLLLASNHYYGLKPPNLAKSIQHSGKAVTAWDAAQKPANVADADWAKRKNDSLSFALWLNGMALAQQNKLNEADPPLRRALPMLTNDQLKAPATFYLGMANFKAGEPAGPGKPPNRAKLTDAFRFFQQCAAIKGPYQQQAANNLKALTGRYAIK